MGLRFKSFILVLQYIFDSELNFAKYFNTQFEKTELKGTGFGLKIQRPLTKKVYWGITFRQVKYTEGNFDGDSYTFGSEKNGFNFSDKTVQSVLLDLSLPIGIF